MNLHSLTFVIVWMLLSDIVLTYMCRAISRVSRLNLDHLRHCSFAAMLEVVGCWVNLVNLVVDLNCRPSLPQNLLNLTLRLDKTLKGINGNRPLEIMR